VAGPADRDGAAPALVRAAGRDPGAAGLHPGPRPAGPGAPAQWEAVERGLAAVTSRMLSLLPAGRAAALAGGPVTIDLDTTDVEVYGRKKRGVAWNHQGQRVGRPHVAACAEAEIVLAADLGDGTDDPRATAPGLLRRALAGLPERARRSGRVAMRPDAGYFAGPLARAAHDAHIGFTIGAKRIAPLWRLLAGLADDAWHDAIEMDKAQVAVAQYCPDWWPADTRLLIRRVLLEPEQVSADPRSRRRRTLHPDQRALPIPELASAGPVYAYSFILTSLDVSSPGKAAAAEHWHRHRTTVENLFRDSKLGAALRHLPSGYPRGWSRSGCPLRGPSCRPRWRPAVRGRRRGGRAGLDPPSPRPPRAVSVRSSGAAHPLAQPALGVRQRCQDHHRDARYQRFTTMAGEISCLNLRCPVPSGQSPGPAAGRPGRARPP